jgi:hypothetical protein
MTKSLITRNQRRLLDGLCDFTEFNDQVTLASNIWPANYSYMRKCWSRLANLGFIKWVTQEGTAFEPRWAITEAGLSYLAKTDG